MANFVPYVADKGRWLDHFERLARNQGKKHAHFYLVKPVQTGKGDHSPVVNVSPTEAEVARAKSDVAMGPDIKDNIAELAQLAQKLQGVKTKTSKKIVKKKPKRKATVNRKHGF